MAWSSRSVPMATSPEYAALSRPPACTWLQQDPLTTNRTTSVDSNQLLYLLYCRSYSRFRVADLIFSFFCFSPFDLQVLRGYKEGSVSHTPHAICPKRFVARGCHSSPPALFARCCELTHTTTLGAAEEDLLHVFLLLLLLLLLLMMMMLLGVQSIV